MAWVSNCIYYKLWDKLLIHSQTSMAQPLKFGNGKVISSHTFLGMWLLIHLGIELNQFILVKRAPERYLHMTDSNIVRYQPNGEVGITEELLLVPKSTTRLGNFQIKTNLILHFRICPSGGSWNHWCRRYCGAGFRDILSQKMFPSDFSKNAVQEAKHQGLND